MQAELKKHMIEFQVELDRRLRLLDDASVFESFETISSDTLEVKPEPISGPFSSNNLGFKINYYFTYFQRILACKFTFVTF